MYVVRKIAVPSKNRHKYVTTRSFKNFNPDLFVNELQTLPWGDIESSDSPNEMWDVWKDLFLNVANKHAPQKTKRVRHKPSPWLTSELEEMIINRNQLKEKFMRSRDPNDWNEYKLNLLETKLTTKYDKQRLTIIIRKSKTILVMGMRFGKP